MDTIVLSDELLDGAAIDPRWESGPFIKLKSLPPKAKGKRFELISHQVFAARGMLVESSTNTDHDRIVDSSKFEIKGSTITSGTDDWFSFMQIRPAQDYEFLILAAFHFDGTIKYFKLGKQTIFSLIESRIFSPQHGGKSGNSGTYLYNGSLRVFEPYYWFQVKIIPK